MEDMILNSKAHKTTVVRSVAPKQTREEISKEIKSHFENSKQQEKSSEKNYKKSALNLNRVAVVNFAPFSRRPSTARAPEYFNTPGRNE
ncbi:hypothetical protein GWI33_003209 [Rhynchophorus ferrugineus]|uniref:Uncharacterized protein n=1 Tax=Rhynchophorus ferrugineus TaxID=354439 RepID=A0A834ITI1_RHYFE|nr:hypothetical protein GWI33_003209 [Rhynchophorus ferrugineus]